MAIRVTLEIPEPLYERLRRRAEQSGASIQSLIIRAIEQTYGESARGEYMMGPMVTGRGRLGPALPEDENPHDLVLS